MENLLIYTIIGFVLYLVFSKPKKKIEYIKRSDDDVIEVIGGRFMLVQK